MKNFIVNDKCVAGDKCRAERCFLGSPDTIQIARIDANGEPHDASYLSVESAREMGHALIQMAAESEAEVEYDRKLYGI